MWIVAVEIPRKIEVTRVNIPNKKSNRSVLFLIICKTNNKIKPSKSKPNESFGFIFSIENKRIPIIKPIVIFVNGKCRIFIPIRTF